MDTTTPAISSSMMRIPLPNEWGHVLSDVERHIIHGQVKEFVRTETLMRMTLDLPEQLIEEAMRLSKHSTKTAVVIAALEDFVCRNALQGLKGFRGKVDLDIDLFVLRGREP